MKWTQVKPNCYRDWYWYKDEKTFPEIRLYCKIGDIVAWFDGIEFEYVPVAYDPESAMYSDGFLTVPE